MGKWFPCYLVLQKVIESAQSKHHLPRIITNQRRERRRRPQVRGRDFATWTANTHECCPSLEGTEVSRGPGYKTLELMWLVLHNCGFVFFASFSQIGSFHYQCMWFTLCGKGVATWSSSGRPLFLPPCGFHVSLGISDWFIVPLQSVTGPALAHFLIWIARCVPTDLRWCGCLASRLPGVVDDECL